MVSGRVGPGNSYFSPGGPRRPGDIRPGDIESRINKPITSWKRNNWDKICTKFKDLCELRKSQRLSPAGKIKIDKELFKLAKIIQKEMSAGFFKTSQSRLNSVTSFSRRSAKGVDAVMDQYLVYYRDVKELVNSLRGITDTIRIFPKP